MRRWRGGVNTAVWASVLWGHEESAVLVQASVDVLRQSAKGADEQRKYLLDHPDEAARVAAAEAAAAAQAAESSAGAETSEAGGGTGVQALRRETVQATGAQGWRAAVAGNGNGDVGAHDATELPEPEAAVEEAVEAGGDQGAGSEGAGVEGVEDARSADGTSAAVEAEVEDAAGSAGGSGGDEQAGVAAESGAGAAGAV